MRDPNDDIKRWTARRKASAVMDIIKGKTTAAELARSHDLTVAEVEQWMDDFVSQGTEALRSHPRDAEAKHRAEKKDLLAKIGDLTMQMEAYKIARDYLGLGKPQPDADS
jgi:transposase-like protein